MKFLAILKDSLREAIDTKVFYVMVGLSVVLTLLTATLSFRPINPTKILQLLTLTLYGEQAELTPDRAMRMFMDPRFKAYAVLAATPRDGAPEGPDSPYRIIVGARAHTAAEAKRVREAPAETMTLLREKFGSLREPGSDEVLHILEVTDVRPTDGEPALREMLRKEKTPEAEIDKEVERFAYFELDTRPTPMTRRFWPHEPSLFFGALPLTFLQEAPLAFQLFLLLDQVVNGIGAWVTILISVVITAFFIPNMLRKGTVDLLLVKPIHRVTLLLYKYVGGLLFIFLNTTVAVVGIWVALGLRSGIWPSSFLLTIFAITFYFAILYAASTLFAVLTRSPIVSILMTCAVWFLIFIVGLLYQFGEQLREAHKEYEERQALKAEKAEKGEEEPKAAEAGRGRRRGRGDDWENQPPPFNPDNAFFTTVRGVRYVLPRSKDLDALLSNVLIRDLLTAGQMKQRNLSAQKISWGESLTVSGIFIALMLGLSCLRFATRDY